MNARKSFYSINISDNYDAFESSYSHIHESETWNYRVLSIMRSVDHYGFVDKLYVYYVLFITNNFGKNNVNVNMVSNVVIGKMMVQM